MRRSRAARPSIRSGSAPETAPSSESGAAHGSARRSAVLAATILLGLVALYGLWLRDSSVVQVERVEVTGLSGPFAPRLRAHVVAAAREMTTLNVRTRDLERALAAHPALKRVEVTPRLPHSLEVRVVEHRPVARLRAGGRDGSAVASDGTLLHGLEASRPLAVVQLGRLPSRSRRRLNDRRGRRLVRALAAAPEPLRGRLSGASEEPRRGLVLRLRRGPEVVLGNLSALRVKWAAAARVLADPASPGAAYVDVRMPDRPVAGGFVPAPARPGPGASDADPTAIGPSPDVAADDGGSLRGTGPSNPRVDIELGGRH